MEKENECPCATICKCEKDDCESRGDCSACFTYHMNHKTPIACKRFEVSKELNDRVNDRMREAGLSEDIWWRR